MASSNYQDLQKNRSLQTRPPHAAGGSGGNRGGGNGNGGGFPALLKQMRPEIERALPRHINPDRMSRIALTEYRKNPQLAKCDVTSVLGSIVVLAQMGLEPGVLGHAYLIPYKDHSTGQMICQPVPGWQGIVDLIARAGRSSVWTGAVYPGDEFDWAQGDRPFILHRPGDEEHDESEITHFYAVGRNNGADWPVIEVWSAKRVQSHRDKHNKVGKRHYSFSNWEMYGRKVVLLQVAKYVQKSVEFQAAIDLEKAAEQGRTIDLASVGDGSWAMPGEHMPGEPADDPATEGAQEASDDAGAAEPDEAEDSAAGESGQEAGDGGAEGGDTGMPQLNMAQAINAVSKAETLDDLDVIRSQISEMPESNRKKVEQNIKVKAEKIQSGEKGFGLD